MKPRALVLLSGGVDSAASAGVCLADGLLTSTLHVSYGQAPEREEQRAAARVAERLRLPFATARIDFARKPLGTGEIPGRNALLALCAYAADPGANLIVLGIRADAPYYDCSPLFVDRLKTLLHEYSGGTTTVLCPVLQWDKPRVRRYARTIGVADADCYWCERGGATPCGRCNSCLDMVAE